MKKGLQEKLILLLLALLLIGGGIWRAVQHNGPQFDTLQAGFTGQLNNNSEEPDQVETAMITVHLVGAVANPGVYHLPSGARVYELLEMSGGLSEDADDETINQARPLYDGEQIYVGSKQESIGPGKFPSQQEERININRATAAEFTSLPGIGEVRAKQIVEYRDKNGFFTDPRELMDISGIGEKTYNNIADLITIY